MDILRVIYVSLAHMEGSGLDQLLRIRGVATPHNAVDGVFTALFYGNGWLMQWLEGPPLGVRQALRRAMKDPRHDGHRIIHESIGERVLRTPWALRAGDMTRVDSQFAEALLTLAPPGRVDTRGEPARLWEDLVAPWTPTVPTTDDPPPRVLLLAASGDLNFERLRQLATRQKMRAVHERYAHSQPGSHDTGGAYLDLPLADGAPVRLKALARSTLDNQLAMLRQPELAIVYASRDDAETQAFLDHASTRLEDDRRPTPCLVVDEAGTALPLWSTVFPSDPGWRLSAQVLDLLHQRNPSLNSAS